MKSKWESEKEVLKQLILVDKVSYEGIGRRYNCSGSNIKKVALRLGIELPQRRIVNGCETFNKGIHTKPISICTNCGKEFYHYSNSTGKFCSLQCQQEYQTKEKYKMLINGDKSIMRANYTPKFAKPIILKEQDGKCAICGMEPVWNGKELIFILDHIDGHASNNRRDNLRLICPNCDSQLDTYKSKNKCGERSYYRYHKYDENTKVGK